MTRLLPDQLQQHNPHIAAPLPLPPPFPKWATFTEWAAEGLTAKTAAPEWATMSAAHMMFTMELESFKHCDRS